MPEIFTIPVLDHPVRWYGVLFALGFIVAQQILFRIFKEEGRPQKDVDKLTGYMVVATIVGARLGHCLFYDPAHFLSNPIEILMVWKGGLASHGAAIAIPLWIYFFTRKHKKYTFLWIMDRLVIVVALVGAMIRTGNLINSEMEGLATHSNVGVVYASATRDVLNYDSGHIESVAFRKGGDQVSEISGIVPITAVIAYKKGVTLNLEDKRFIENGLRNRLTNYREVTEHVDFGDGPLSYKITEQRGRQILEIYALGTVRHIAQIYEAIYCIFLMLLLLWLWHKKRTILPEGFNFALFLIILWTLRFIDEFFKMNQEAFEDNLVLNMGQWLSIPIVLAGGWLMIRIQKRNRKSL